MAVLKHPHWDRVPPILREVIVYLGQCPFSRRFYLAGGTALALQLGHRVSVDLDFFSESDELLDESRQEIITALQERFSLEIIQDVIGRLFAMIQESHVHFFSYGYPLLAPTLTVEGVALAGLVDIGLMKMDAVAGRGARKDFYDLYFIAQNVPLEEMLERGREKYGHMRNFAMMVLPALVNFESGDLDKPIQSFPPVDWEVIQDFFVQEARRIGQKWFEQR